MDSLDGSNNREVEIQKVLEHFIFLKVQKVFLKCSISCFYFFRSGPKNLSKQLPECFTRLFGSSSKLASLMSYGHLITMKGRSKRRMQRLVSTVDERAWWCLQFVVAIVLAVMCAIFGDVVVDVFSTPHPPPRAPPGPAPQRGCSSNGHVAATWCAPLEHQVVMFLRRALFFCAKRPQMPH